MKLFNHKVEEAAVAGEARKGKNSHGDNSLS